MLDDVSSIVRRRPGDPFDPLPRQVKTQAPYFPLAQDLCRELRDVFEMATAGDLNLSLLSASEQSSLRSPLTEATIERARHGKVQHMQIMIV